MALLVLGKRKVNINVLPGKITTGKRRDDGLPQALDYWNIEDFPELREWYGQQPKTLLLRFPSNVVTDIFSEALELWAGGGKKGKSGTKVRSCDGATCIHRITETIGGKQYIAGEMSPCVCDALGENDKQRCRYSGYLKAFVVNPNTGKIGTVACHLFETHSANSGGAIRSELEKMYVLTKGRIAMLPFVISIRMVSGREDAKKQFPIWNLSAVGQLADINAFIEKYADRLTIPDVDMPRLEPPE